MKISLADVLRCIPGPASKEWPQGERYAEAFAHGSMSVGLYAPVGADPQTPHSQDELYIIRTGHADFILDGTQYACKVGDILFVAAGVTHHFEKLAADFSAWVVFWGPKGGEPTR